MKNPEHRVRTTKRQLREALMACLAEKPLRSITVKELCERAKINRGTFYTHYADVFDLLEQIEAEMETEFFAALNPTLAEDGQLTPPKVTKRIFECIETNADLCRVIIGPYGDKEFARRLIRRSKEDSMIRSQKYFPNAAPWQFDAYFTFISAGCFALMENWLRGGTAETSATLADAAEKIMELAVGFLQQEAPHAV